MEPEIDRNNLTASYVLDTVDRLVADFNATHPKCELLYLYTLSGGLNFYPLTLKAFLGVPVKATTRPTTPSASLLLTS